MRHARSAPRRSLAILASSGLLVLAMGAGSPVLGGDGGDIVHPVDNTHNVFDAPSPVSNAVFGTDNSLKAGQKICTVATPDANKNTDCEAAPGPHNETSIAVNPTDGSNILGGANDYQLALNPGGQVSENVLSRAHVTFDSGAHWSEYPIIFSSTYQATGDPSVAFDASGHAYYATLGFRFVGLTNAQAPDILVANSGDGGKTWASVKVASGTGNFGSVGDSLDKEYIAAWGSGNAIVTYGDFKLGQNGRFLNSRIYASVTHDYGTSWSTPHVISGTLDEAFVATPTVDGSTIAVSFLNTTDLATGRDDYEVVKVSQSTGLALGAPVKVATVIDGATDYPIAFGRQTYQDSLFRSWAAGNITADPTDASHLAVVWSDMRNSTTPAPANPYAATTNSDVIVSQSTDGGAHWSATPVSLALSGDQWMPWGAYDSTGILRIGYFDRSADSANHLYNYSVATETGSGTLAFTSAAVSTVASDPTTNDRWFAASVSTDPSFAHATSFLGDYSNIAATADGHVVAYWTDLRNTACFAGTCRSGEDAYFAAAP